MYCGVLWAVQAWHRHLALDVLHHETLLWLAAVLTACMQDIRAMNDHAMKAAPRKTGAILLGGGMLCLCMSAAALFCCCSGKHSCGTFHSPQPAWAAPTDRPHAVIPFCLAQVCPSTTSATLT